jgi:hypothetical protein
MGVYLWQWHYNETQHTKIHVSHKEIDHVQTKHSTQSYTNNNGHIAHKESKAILATDRGGLYGSEMSKISHCLDIRFIDGGKVVSPTHRPRFTHRNIIFLLLVHVYVRGRVNAGTMERL